MMCECEYPSLKRGVWGLILSLPFRNLVIFRLKSSDFSGMPSCSTCQVSTAFMTSCVALGVSCPRAPGMWPFSLRAEAKISRIISRHFFSAGVSLHVCCLGITAGQFSSTWVKYCHCEIALFLFRRVPPASPCMVILHVSGANAPVYVGLLTSAKLL